MTSLGDNMRFYDDLDKAIEQLSASKHANPECQADRQQMCEWLKELKQLREEKIVWIVIANRTLDVYDTFDVALERYNQLANKGLKAIIHKRPVRSEISGFATMD